MKRTAQQFDIRQSMNCGDFEIFYYQDQEPGNVALHHHDFYEIYYFLGGHVLYRVDGKQFRLQKGDLLLINPMEFHQPLVLSKAEPYERIVLWINKDFLNACSPKLARCFDMTLPTHENLLRTSEADSPLLNLLDNLVQEFHSDAYCSEIYARGLFLQFLSELNRYTMLLPSQSNAALPLAAQVIGYIGRHYREPLSLDSLSEHFFVSKYHLSHVFSKATGVSVYRYIVLKRLQVSREMLLEGHTPKEAYSASGFGDYANFYRAFQQAYGVTPGNFSEQSFSNQ